MPHQSQFALWRVGVVGSSHALTPNLARMCEALGEQLAKEKTVLIVHGGLKRRSLPANAGLAADWHFILGAKRRLAGSRHERVETLLADPHIDTSTPSPERRARADDLNAEMFIEGTLRRIDGRTRESRRFAFVNSLDALVAVGGGGGTRQQLTLATAIDKPILPVPCFEGAARDFWKEHRDTCKSRLNIDERKARAWERQPARADIKARAKDMVLSLLKRLPRRVFVIMPFAAQHDTLYDLVILPAVQSKRDTVWRLDRLQASGAVTEHIKDGIRSCDYCIVVLDGMRPNVLFEMGYAEALGKPMIVLLRLGQDDDSQIPFDISTLNRIEYTRPDGEALNRLKNAVHYVVPRARL